MEGWITIHRKLLEWEWYTDANTSRLFLHLLLKANHKANAWRGITIDRGQLITSHDTLATELRLSIQKIRTSLKKLKATHEIATKATNKYTVVTICKYGEYQPDKNESNKRITFEQQTSNKQVTTNNNDNNKNNVRNRVAQTATHPKSQYLKKTIQDREADFRKELKANFSDQYPTVMLEAFASYWTESSPGGKKMRFEKQAAFDIARRLTTWASKDFNQVSKTKRTPAQGISRETDFPQPKRQYGAYSY